MGKFLVIFDGNWADEMDLQGFMIVSQEAWNYKLREWANTEFPCELGVGTNEAVEYDKLSDYIKEFKTQEITNEEEEIIRRLFSIGSKWADFGHMPWIEGNASDSFYEENGHCPD